MSLGHYSGAGTVVASSGITAGETPCLRLRVRSTSMRFHRGAREWMPGDTSEFTAIAFAGQAERAARVIRIGDEVVLIGRSRTNPSGHHEVVIEAIGISLEHALPEPPAQP